MLLLKILDRVQYKSKGRLFLIFLTLLTGIGSLGYGPVLTAVFASENGPRTLLSLAFIILGLLALVDLVINEFLPERFVLKSTLRRRHAIYAGIAICDTLGAIQAGIYGNPVFLFFFAGSVVAAFVAGFADIFKRYTPDDVVKN